jgi:hypothetical protein
MTYTINQFGSIVRDSDGAFIPSDPANTDYAAYLDWVAVGNKPTTPTLSLAQAQANQISVLSSACQNAIYAGFTSTALGAEYHYPFLDKDQSNLVSSVTASLLPGVDTSWATPFWCADSAGVWAFRLHTAAQIQRVGMDAMVTKLNAIQRNNDLCAAVNAATTVAQVQAITW